jgi:hypothetical protein
VHTLCVHLACKFNLNHTQWTLFVSTFKREPPSLKEKKLFLVITSACTLEKGVS